MTSTGKEPISTEIAESNSCPHPKLASWEDIFTHNQCYKCMGCGKEISIPIMDFYLEEDATRVHLTEQLRAVAVRERCVGILGLAFGEQWREKMMSGDYERRWT